MRLDIFIVKDKMHQIIKTVPSGSCIRGKESLMKTSKRREGKAGVL